MEMLLSSFGHNIIDGRPSVSDNIGVVDFLKEAWDDYNSPTASTFVSKLAQCRATATNLEETLDCDRSGLTKMKKSIKALYSSGNMHVTNESYLAENLKRLGSSQTDNDVDISVAFSKFAVVTVELSALMKNLMQNLSNIVMFPLDSFLKGDLRGVKGDLKKPFDKASKEYDAKFAKIEKEKKALAKEAGFIKTEVCGAEVAEEMEKERRMFQLQMCEYLIKVNEIKTKKGVDLLQHFVDYYQAQHNFFQDGLKTIEHFRCYVEDLVSQLGQLKQKQDAERRKLLELRDVLRTFMSSYKEPPPVASVYSLHQLQGNKEHGYERSGFLLKRSEGRMRKVWQKRRCIVKDGMLSIGHSDSNKEPVKLNLLTCQVKMVVDDLTKKCFDLISSSKNRTYHFQADDTQEMEAWISVLNNAKEQVLLKAFGDSAGSETSPFNQSVKELTRMILRQIKRLPGNQMCCDCGAPDPEWLSVNLGVLICLECCGVHREMGVHVSRTQSIVIDDLGTAQLLLARIVTNQGFNEIMEATLDPRNKPTPKSNMEEKKSFIRSKYEKRRYAIVTCADLEDRRQDLKQAILSYDIHALLQVYAEGIDFVAPLPDMDNEETSLHLAILQDDGSYLYMVDFIIQNTNSQELSRRTKDGNTALHLCATYDKPECMKLLLRTLPDLVNYENYAGLTALEIAKSKNYDVCVELLSHAISGKTELFEHVNFDWGFVLEEHQHDAVDYSDDELDAIVTPERRTRSRPGSLIMMPDSTVSMNPKERSLTTECHRVTSTVPIAKPKPPSQRNRQQNATGNAMPPPATIPPAGGGGGTNQSAAAAAALAAQKKKAPPPPPPAGAYHGHMRNPSDPGFGSSRGHLRSPSDPPPLPAKTGQVSRMPSGAKFVLPPVVPPKLRTPDEMAQLLSGNPKSRTQSTSGILDGGDLSTTQSASSRLTCYIAASADTGPSPTGAAKTTTTPAVTPPALSPPLPVGGSGATKPAGLRRCIALYDCQADNEDELSFHEGEIINVLGEEEDEWFEGEIASQPERRGMFPATFVKFLS